MPKFAPNTGFKMPGIGSKEIDSPGNFRDEHHVDKMGYCDNTPDDMLPEGSSPLKARYTTTGYRKDLDVIDAVNLSGPHEEHKGNQASPITKFTKQAEEEGKITIFTDSENYKRDFVCVSDVCKIHEKMFDIKEKGIYNIGTGKAVSFKQIADLIAKKYNAKIKYIPMPENLKHQYQSYTCANLEKLNTVLKFKFQTIEEYLK